MISRKFHIHGDNIVECERFLELINKVLTKMGGGKVEKKSSFICPNYTFNLENQELTFQFLPGIKSSVDKNSKQRWDNNILDIVKKRGGPLREAADVLFTEIIDSKEKPLVAIEYCSALPAGNQAWQRSGRSYSYGKAKIPLLYVVDIGGYELNADRENISTRLPTSTVPFSYISFSELNRIQVSQIFMSNFGTSQEIRARFGDIFGEHTLLNYIEEVLFNNNNLSILNDIRDKQLKFILNTSKEIDNKKFTKTQWQRFFEVITQNQDVIGFLEKEGVKNWSKKISIDTTTSLKDHLALVKELCLGITQHDLPFCLISGKERKSYLSEIKKIYQNKLTVDFYTWIESSEKPLILCWMAGFKPKGDDSRPDRGLLPLCRMLLGEDVEILTVIYGPAPINSINALKNSPNKLKANGLWEAILDGSNGLIIDSKTSQTSDQISFLKKDWEMIKETNNVFNETELMSPYINPYPLNFSENDVDSLIHNFFKTYQEANICFEASCNPPGGDWSGISYFNKIDNLEYRWLTLPRVGTKSVKRPDHVIQIFGEDNKIYILSIESKDYAKNIESDIGPQLSRYVQYLFNMNCNASRQYKGSNWADNVFSINDENIIYASGVAFLTKISSKNQKSLEEAINSAEIRSNSDISFTIGLVDGLEKLDIKALTKKGQDVLKVLKKSSHLFEKTDLELNFS